MKHYLFIENISAFFLFCCASLSYLLHIFLAAHLSDPTSHSNSSRLAMLAFYRLNVNLSILIFFQPLVQPPLTLQKMSPNICPPSPPGKPTGGHGTAALGHSTYLSPLMSSQTTSQASTCPQVVWVISSLQHLDAPGVCQIPPLPGEVIS